MRHRALTTITSRDRDAPSPVVRGPAPQPRDTLSTPLHHSTRRGENRVPGDVPIRASSDRLRLSAFEPWARWIARVLSPLTKEADWPDVVIELSGASGARKS